MPKKPKAKKRKASTTPEIRPPAISFEKIALRHISFREVKPQPPGERKAERIGVDLKMDGQIRVGENGLEVTLEFRVIPDPSQKPFELEFALSGWFKGGDDVTKEELGEFGQNSAVQMLYPYARELISDISARGIHGTLLMDPLFLTAESVEISKPQPSDSLPGEGQS